MEIDAQGNLIYKYRVSLRVEDRDGIPHSFHGYVDYGPYSREFLTEMMYQLVRYLDDKLDEPPVEWNPDWVVN